MAMLAGRPRRRRGLVRGSRPLLEAMVDPLRLEPRIGPRRCAEILGRAPLAHVLALFERHRLGPLWLDALERAGAAPAVAPELGWSLGADRRQAATGALLHERAMEAVGAALDAAAVEHVFLKGLALARLAYDDPALRPAGDVDVVVAPAARDAAAHALEALGLEPAPDPATATHEVALMGRGVCVDLHWHVVRPGRARRELGEALLGSRRRHEGAWIGGDAETLAALLVHNALCDHVTARLVRAVDLDRLARLPGVDWDAVVRLARDAGLGVAAWASLEWTHEWLRTPVDPAVARALAPGRARAAWLEAWLAADPASRYFQAPIAVRVGFSLALEDRPSDILRSVGTLVRSG